MPQINHRVVMTAPPAVVFDAVASRDGLSEWWTRDGVRGESREGSRLEFSFGQPEPSAVMEVTAMRENTHVGWLCVGGAEEWIGTRLTFDLAAQGDETVVMFAHADWREHSDFMAHCSARWAYFLLSLKSYVEDGKGTPFPEDLKF